MTPLQIDFGTRPRFRNPVAIGFIAAGCLLALAATWEYWVTEDEATDLAQRAESLRLSAAQQQQKLMRPEPKLSSQTVDAINRAITRLNLPWEAVFTALEADLPQDVALLEIVPGSRRSLRLVAESPTPESMTNFIEKLTENGYLAEVTLVKHEINEQDPNRPIRFVLEAQWGGIR